jgi:hypothetical protein
MFRALFGGSNMPLVFFSYAREDSKVVDMIARDLRRAGVNSWLDRDNLRPGEPWMEQISNAIKQADYMLIFYSRATLSSLVVRGEYQAAFERQKQVGGERVIPVLLEKVELPRDLAAIHYVDFSESYSEGMAQLLRSLDVSGGPRPSDIVPPQLAEQIANEVAKLLGMPSRAGDVHPQQQPSQIDQNLVFVVTPFTADLDPIFEGISAAGLSLGLDVKRVKDIQGDYRITDEIVRMLNSAWLIVVDLTHERPNVYFELGYARGLGKTVVTIAREGTTVHFDVKDWVYIPYVDSRLLERDLKKRFEYELSKRPDASTANAS